MVVGVDQATKSWAVADLHDAVHLLGPLGLQLAFNSGTAFSLFSGAGAWLTPLALVVLAGVGWAAWAARSRLRSVGFGLVLGGAAGNLADRLFRGHHGAVVDFVTLSHWPTFNVADASITVGVVLLMAGYLWPGRLRHRAPEGGSGVRGRVDVGAPAVPPAGPAAPGGRGVRDPSAHP